MFSERWILGVWTIMCSDRPIRRARGLRMGLIGALAQVKSLVVKKLILTSLFLCVLSAMRVFCVEKREGLETPDKEWFYWRHGTSSSIRVWMFYQQQVVPGLGWMVLDSSRVICWIIFRVAGGAWNVSKGWNFW